jgi:hypothetical protein
MKEREKVPRVNCCELGSQLTSNIRQLDVNVNRPVLASGKSFPLRLSPAIQVMIDVTRRGHLPRRDPFHHDELNDHTAPAITLEEPADATLLP